MLYPSLPVCLLTYLAFLTYLPRTRLARSLAYLHVPRASVSPRKFHFAQNRIHCAHYVHPPALPPAFFSVSVLCFLITSLRPHHQMLLQHMFCATQTHTALANVDREGRTQVVSGGCAFPSLLQKFQPIRTPCFIENGKVTGVALVTYTHLDKTPRNCNSR